MYEKDRERRVLRKHFLLKSWYCFLKPILSGICLPWFCWAYVPSSHSFLVSQTSLSQELPCTAAQSLYQHYPLPVKCINISLCSCYKNHMVQYHQKCKILKVQAIWICSQVHSFLLSVSCTCDPRLWLGSSSFWVPHSLDGCWARLELVCGLLLDCWKPTCTINHTTFKQIYFNPEINQLIIHHHKHD